MATLNVISIIGISLTIISITNKKQYDHQNVENINILNVKNRKFDYIVVGAGAAGAIVAYRLADEAGSTVLLLEAGGPQNLYNDIPALQDKDEYAVQNWKYPTNESNQIAGGRVFGGSSAINSMNYYRESPEYYRLWTEITGLSEWTFDKVLPYFLKSENNLDHKLVAENSGYHRTGGRVTVTSSESNAMMKHLMIGAEMLGHKKTFGDGREPMGAAVLQNTIDTNRSRVSTEKAFLENNKLKNFKIFGNSMVTKVIFNNQKQATGVEFSRYGRKYRVFANKEVILSAGSIGSSKLLMLSGVGPRDHLKQFEIPVVADLNVGHNFVFPLIAIITFDIINQSMVEPPTETIDHLIDYYIRHTGPLGYNQSTIICFPEQAYSQSYPELSNGCLLARTGLVNNRMTLFAIAVVRRPKTTGRIELVSNDPFKAPVAKTCTVCDSTDVDKMVKVFKSIIQLYTSPYMRQFIQFNPIGGGCTPCAGDNYSCDDYLRCIVKKYTSPALSMGGCRIGVSPETGAVVDKTFRVFGVQRLRVIDSSIIPVPTEQGMTISMMIGEYGSHTVINGF
ncbi:ecdysone oxidase-like [Oppia nitens]|uniref:ecdysone oxidase-like n=1 Tax=Oppia nitens TaxID=1686743 RepID=UPI0023DBFF07|nr:ecdysone oxidase-like [Oppia nitens]